MRDQTPNSGRKDLVVTGLAFGVSAAILFALDKPVIPYVALALALIALFGSAFFQSIGHRIHASITTVRRSIQRVVSYVVLTVVYFGFVSILGLILSFFGMDRLRKDFDKCKAMPSMFEEAPATDLDNFRRQS